ncbi:hypothetical protein GCM10010298_22750 [Streptomyces microflavus]|uniref:Uncharacterized protein n=1 Tax=Streptomyces microflavus TaxID=1919 RepID=A0A7J0D2B6_STRMI|nr:hypothetical protein Smic_74620 [Streptomyces microflavus]GGX57882.1 hypothetical protein GCM10010298_22750 [Streptomyces microflavus]
MERSPRNSLPVRTVGEFGAYDQAQSPCRHTPGKDDEFSDLVGDGPVPEDLAPHRAPYAALARHLARRRCEVSTDRPERAAAFCAETKEWPQGSGRPA